VLLNPDFRVRSNEVNRLDPLQSESKMNLSDVRMKIAIERIYERMRRGLIGLLMTRLPRLSIRCGVVIGKG